MVSEVQKIPLVDGYSCTEDALIICGNKSYSARSIKFPHGMFYNVNVLQPPLCIHSCFGSACW